MTVVFPNLRLEREKTRQGAALDLLERVEFLRLDAGHRLEQSRRGALGQYLTPAPVAQLMASMLSASSPVVSILDAGAGVGSLFAACVSELCRRETHPKEIKVTAYEIDPILLTSLNETVELCRHECERYGILFSASIISEDFIQAAVCLLSRSLFCVSATNTYSVAILNPPYRKINLTFPPKTVPFAK